MHKTILACVGLFLIGVPVLAQDPLQHPLLAIDEPYYEGGTVGRDFGIRGTALNSDYVHVWAFPASGPVWLGAAVANQPDPQRKLGGGVFSLFVTGAPIGDYPVVVYAHEASTGTFPTSMVLQMHVTACAWFTVSWPFVGVTGATIVQLPFCAAQQ